MRRLGKDSINETGDVFCVVLAYTLISIHGFSICNNNVLLLNVLFMQTYRVFIKFICKWYRNNILYTLYDVILKAYNLFILLIYYVLIFLTDGWFVREQLQCTIFRSSHRDRFLFHAQSCSRGTQWVSNTKSEKILFIAFEILCSEVMK